MIDTKRNVDVLVVIVFPLEVLELRLQLTQVGLAIPMLGHIVSQHILIA